MAIWRLFPDSPGYSSNSPGPMGTKAFYLLVGEMGYNVSRLEGPYSELRRGLLISTDRLPGPLSTGGDNPTAGEIAGEKLAGWVRNGGTLLFLASGGSPAADALGLEFEGRFSGGETPVRKTGYTMDINRLQLGPAPYIKVRNATAHIIAGNADGAVALAYTLGKGQVIVLPDPGVITNSRIDKSDNVIFLMNVIRAVRPEKIWFDESGGLGPAQRPDQTVKVNDTVVIAGIQAALALLLIFIYWGRRFGRPVPLPSWEEGAAASYVDVMANVFRQGQAREIALDNIFTGFWRRLSGSLGIPAGTGREQVINICSRRSGMDGEGLKRILSAVDKYRLRGSISEAELFSLVRDMEIWRRENLKHAGY